MSFRYYTRQKALELQLTGLVENRSSPESVHIEVEGEEKMLQEFIDWCRQGPPSAQVSRLTSKEGEVKSFSDFQIK